MVRRTMGGRTHTPAPLTAAGPFSSSYTVQVKHGDSISCIPFVQRTSAQMEHFPRVLPLCKLMERSMDQPLSEARPTKVHYSSLGRLPALGCSRRSFPFLHCS